jgi:hypothetical protein
VITKTATRQVSQRVRIAARISSASVGSRDFRAILSVHELTPDLRGPGGAHRAIRAYYLVVEKIGRLIPAVTDWAEGEMALCSRYAAVLVDQHLESNMECANHARGI